MPPLQFLLSICLKISDANYYCKYYTYVGTAFLFSKKLTPKALLSFLSDNPIPWLPSSLSSKKLLLYRSCMKCLRSLCGLLGSHQCCVALRKPCIQLPDLFVLHFKLLILMLQFTLQHGNQRRFGGFASFATWFRMLRNLLSLNSPIMLIYQCFCGFVDCETCFRIFRNMVSPTPCTDCLL